MNRNRTPDTRSARAVLLPCLMLACAWGCQHKSLLSDPAILTQAQSVGPESETLVLQAGNWEKPEAPEAGSPQADLRIAETFFRAEQYEKAAKAFEEGAEKHKKLPEIHERALFMKAESEFQQGLYGEARDSFQEFRKAYPGSRQLSATMQRLFAIGDTWLEDARQDVRHGRPSSVHRFLNVDPERKPLFDIDGHAIETLKYVRENDPNGPLADDSLMMAAGYQFTMGNFREADLLTDQLIHSYPHSEHQARAHLMNAESKIQSYKGANYDSRKLEEARRTLRSAIAQFPDELEPERQRLYRELEEIRQEQAKAQFEVGEWYRRMAERTPKLAEKYKGSARLYYEYVQRNFAGTKWSDRAGERLAGLDRPATAAIQPESTEEDAGDDSNGSRRSWLSRVWK